MSKLPYSELITPKDNGTTMMEGIGSVLVQRSIKINCLNFRGSTIKVFTEEMTSSVQCHLLGLMRASVCVVVVVKGNSTTDSEELCTGKQQKHCSSSLTHSLLETQQTYNK